MSTTRAQQRNGHSNKIEAPSIKNNKIWYLINLFVRPAVQPPNINSGACDFQCWDKKCLPWAARCDRKRDCSRGEDEMKCETQPTQPKPQPKPQRITGTFTVHHNGAGMGGSAGNSLSDLSQPQGGCPLGGHMCNSGECLTADKRCNYVYDCCVASRDPDCRDWSDEDNCSSGWFLRTAWFCAGA